MPQVPHNTPSELAGLLLQMNPELVEMFTEVLTILPRELSNLFSIRLNSLLTPVRTTLPQALTSPPPENFGFSPGFSARLRQLATVITIVFGAACAIVTLFDPTEDLRDVCSLMLTTLHTGLYANPIPDLHGLYHNLNSVLFQSLLPQPYSALTNFPIQVCSLLNNIQHSELLSLSMELNRKMESLIYEMFAEIVELIRAELIVQDDSPTAADNDLDELTHRFVYHTTEDAETCSICLEDMEDGDDARCLGCSHTFHTQCIDQWLETKDTCPLCRIPIAGPQE